MRRIYRYVVPLDGKAHSFHLTGSPVHVGIGKKENYEVDFWAENDTSELWLDRQFRVFGTGDELPDGARYFGTAPRTKQGLIWHLYEVTS